MTESSNLFILLLRHLKQLIAIGHRIMPGSALALKATQKQKAQSQIAIIVAN